MLLAAAASGCGGGEPKPSPKPFPAALAQDLAARSDSVARLLEAGDPCAARREADALRARAVAAVNERRIPARYQEELLASIGALAESIACVPAPTTTEEGANEDSDEDRAEADRKGKRKGKEH